MDIASIGRVPPVMAQPAATAPMPSDFEQRALIRAVKAINAAEMLGSENELTFVFDRASRRAIVRIVNRETREVVRQLPPQYVLNLAEETREE